MKDVKNTVNKFYLVDVLIYLFFSSGKLFVALHVSGSTDDNSSSFSSLKYFILFVSSISF